ncbi:hypothetical protein [Catenuloplanes nepalensis]|nr:hypothetical protein [Catenuloplanes nepalensis]
MTDDQGRILLIHRTDNDNWAVPGGAMDLGSRCRTRRCGRRWRIPASTSR